MAGNIWILSRRLKQVEVIVWLIPVWALVPANYVVQGLVHLPRVYFASDFLGLWGILFRFFLLFLATYTLSIHIIWREPFIWHESVQLWSC